MPVKYPINTGPVDPATRVRQMMNGTPKKKPPVRKPAAKAKPKAPVIPLSVRRAQARARSLNTAGLWVLAVGTSLALVASEVATLRPDLVDTAVIAALCGVSLFVFGALRFIGARVS